MEAGGLPFLIHTPQKDRIRACCSSAAASLSSSHCCCCCCCRCCCSLLMLLLLERERGRETLTRGGHCWDCPRGRESWCWRYLGLRKHEEKNNKSQEDKKCLCDLSTKLCTQKQDRGPLGEEPKATGTGSCTCIRMS